MSYENFKETVMAAMLERESHAELVAMGFCDRTYEAIAGNAKRVKINGIGKVTIKNYVVGTDIDSPQSLIDDAQFLDLDQQKYFNVAIDDIDAQQAKGNIQGIFREEGAEAIAQDADKYVLALHDQAGLTHTQAAATSGNVYSDLTEINTKLSEKNVKKNDRFICVAPWYAGRMGLAKIRFKTENTSVEKMGYVGTLETLGMEVYESNNVPTTVADSKRTSKMMAGSKKAIKFVMQFTKLEAYRPEKQFSDALKGLAVYGAKVVRSDQLLMFTATEAAETVI